jgi:hypothetical protein
MKRVNSDALARGNNSFTIQNDDKIKRHDSVSRKNKGAPQGKEDQEIDVGATTKFLHAKIMVPFNDISIEERHSNMPKSLRQGSICTGFDGLINAPAPP